MFTPLASPFLDPLVVLVAGACFGVLFQIPLRDVPASCCLSVLGWYTLKATAGLGVHLAHSSFLAACVVGLASNALARWLGRPSQVFLIPGVILLVPGSVGYRAMQSLLQGQQTVGITLALDTALIAGGIAAGMLLAHLMLPSRKIL